MEAVRTSETENLFQFARRCSLQYNYPSIHSRENLKSY
jgi:hypothetical protein